MQVRTRMAPSPTGEYHIGHIRTLLYNYAWAKKNKGRFIIRIEDTDRERFVEGATERILDVITDYGLTWDEGPRVGGPFEPYVQSQRQELYKKYADDLVSKRWAYHCFCTKDRLEELKRKRQLAGQLPMYDRRCRNLGSAEIKKRLANNEPSVIRLKVPDNETIEFADIVMGKISVQSSALDDQVLLKSDGYPTYHLAVVVDDHLMKISHVIRGNEWISSTPKHVLLYSAFGWEMPAHAHLPVFLDPQGQGKMSKRKGAVSARSFLEEGYLPEAILNYLMLLGWNPGTEQELFTLPEFVEAFDLANLNKANPRFTYEKLNWFNQKYIQALDNVTLAGRIAGFTKQSEAEITKVLPLVKDRLVILTDFDRLTDYLWQTPTIEPELLQKYQSSTKSVLEHTTHILGEKWDGKLLEVAARDFCSRENIKVGDYFMILRIAVTGRIATPPLWDVMEVLGKKETLSRLLNTANAT